MSGLTEEWRPIPGYEGRYEVSNRGRVAALNFARSGKRGLLSQRTLEYGHKLVDLWKFNKREQLLVHRLVLETFVSPCPKGCETRHLDGNAGNNWVVNLKWGTPKENGEDRVRHRTHAHGEDHYAAKLTEDAVREIRKRCAAGELQRVVGADFGITQNYVTDIVRRRRWKHIA